MKFCTNCGAKLEKNNNFCTECGQRIQKAKDFQKPILILGIFLVLFASFLLGVFSWRFMSYGLRIIFFGFETVLFIALSFVLKKINSKLDQVFLVVGLLLFPYTMSLFPYYSLLPSSLNSGAGLHIYLASIYLAIFFIYLIINNSVKNMAISIINLVLVLASSINIGLACSNRLTVIALIITSYITVLHLLSYLNILRENLKKAIDIVVSVFIMALLPFLVINFCAFNKEATDIIIDTIVLVLYVILNYTKMLKTDYMKAISPILLNGSLFTFIIASLIDYDFVYFYIIIGLSGLLYIISILIGDKLFKASTLIVTYASLIILYIITYLIHDNYLMPFLAIFLLLLINIENIVIEKNTYPRYFLPVLIYFNIFTFIKMFSDIERSYVLLSTSLVYLLVYLFFKLLNKKESFIYIVGAFIISVFSYTYLTSGINALNICIMFVSILIFIFCKMFNENKVFSLISYIGLNIASVLLFYNTTKGLYYSLLIISSVTLISSIIIAKMTNTDQKVYITYSEVLIFLVTLFNDMSYGIVILLINMLIYFISYLSILKYNNKKVFRIIYLTVGLITITRMIYLLIEPIIFSSILSIIVIVIIVLLIFLLNIEDAATSSIISLSALFPYIRLIYHIFDVFNEFALLPLVFYIFIVTELYHYQKESDRKLVTIILYAVLAYLLIYIGSGTKSIIIDLIVGFIYILIGLYRRNNGMIILGFVFILLVLLLKLFTLLNSISVLILLIILGFILIGIAIYFEVKKKE